MAVLHTPEARQHAPTPQELPVHVVPGPYHSEVAIPVVEERQVVVPEVSVQMPVVISQHAPEQTVCVHVAFEL
jgi:hypothetical protein